MRRVLPLALVLCNASGAHAADPLTADESGAAYCVGVAQARVLAYERMATAPCERDTAHCGEMQQVAKATLPRLRRELDASIRALAAYGNSESGRKPNLRRAGLPHRIEEAIASGQREALLCLNMRLPGMPDPGVGDIGQSCGRIAACATGPNS